MRRLLEGIGLATVCGVALVLVLWGMFTFVKKHSTLCRVLIVQCEVARGDVYSSRR